MQKVRVFTSSALKSVPKKKKLVAFVVIADRSGFIGGKRESV